MAHPVESVLVRFDVFAEELADLHTHINLFNKESSTPLKKVRKISTSCKVFNKKCVPEMHKLFKIYCGIALVSASAKKEF